MVGEAHAAGASAEGAHAAFPPFDASLFASQLFWFALTFGALYFILSRVTLPSVAAVVARRERTIKADLDVAAREGNAAEILRGDMNTLLADGRAHARKMVEDARAEALAALASERAKAEDKLAAQAASAETRIGDMRGKALKDVEKLSADLARDIVGRLTGTNKARA